MAFPPIGVTALIGGMAVFNRDAAIVEGRLRSINSVTRQMEAQSAASAGRAAAAFAGMAASVTVASTVIAGAAVLAAGAAIKFAADFEQGMALTQALTGATDTEMKKLEDTIISLSRKGTLGMEELNKAAVELARAGVPVQDVMDGALEAVQNLTIASGGEIGLEKAAKLTATAMNAFGLSVEEIDRVTTAATVVAQNSALTFTDFGTAVQYAGATFQAAGFSIEDLATAEALLGKNGITASVAATSLRGVVQRLIRPSADAKKVMDEYGISLFDSQGKALGFDAVMKQLRDAFSDQAVASGKLTEEQRLQAISTLGLQRTGAAFLILANTTSEELDALRASFERLKITDLVARQLNTLNSQTTIARNNIVAMAYAFGQQFLPALTDAMKANVAFLQSLDLEIFRQFGRDVIAFGATIKENVSGAIQTVMDFLDAFQLVGPIIEFAKNTLEGLAIVIGVTLAAGLASVLGPWLLFFGAIGTAVTAAKLLWPSIEPFVRQLPSLGEILDAAGKKLDELGAMWAPWAAQAGAAGRIVEGVLTGVHGLIESLQFILQGNFPAAAASAEGAMGQFKGIIAEVIPIALDLWGRVVDITKALWEHREVVAAVAVAYASFRTGLAIAGLIQTLVGAWGALTGAIGAAGGVIGAIVAVLGGPVTIAIVAISVIVGLLAAAWISNWGDIQGKTAAVVDFVISAAKNLWSTLVSAFDAIKSAISAAWDKVIEITMAVWNALPANIREDLVAIVEGVTEILGLLALIAHAKWTQFKDAAIEVINNLVDEARRLIDYLKTEVLAIIERIATEVVPKVILFMENVIATVKALTKPVVDAALQLGRDLIQGLIDGVLANVGRITAAIRGVVEAALGAARAAADARSPSRKMRELGEDLDEGLEQGLEDGAYDVVAAAEDVVASVESSIVDKLDAAKRPIRGTAASLVDELINELYSIQSRLDVLGTDMQSKMTQIGEEVGRKINEAIVDAAEAIERVVEDTNQRIQDMVDNLAQSRSDRARREGLGSDQDARRAARRSAQEEADLQKKRAREDADLEKKRIKDLNAAKFQLGQDLDRANTDKERENAREKYNEKVADIAREFALDMADRAEKRALEDQDRADARRRKQEDEDFERALDEETRQFNDALEDEALARSIARSEAERDKRIEDINRTLEEKQNKIRAQADREVKELHENTLKKIKILEEEFARKAADVLRKGGEDMRPLVDNIQGILSGNFDLMRSSAEDFTSQVEDAIGALKRLHEEAQRAAFSAPTLPSPLRGLGSTVEDDANPIPSFQEGGLVPGRYGEKMLAWVHGGEYIAGLHSEASRLLRQMTNYQPHPGDTYNLNLNPSYTAYESPASVELDMRALIAMARG